MSDDLLGLMRAALRRCGLDLSGLTVLTEAASGAYAVTPVLAAMAGARRVFALARASRYGTVAQIAREVLALAEEAGVTERIEVLTEKSRAVVASADIITNSGHLRPLDRAMIDAMKPTAVVPLMYEAWELRDADLDVAACRARGIAVAGTNERHPAVNVFSFLGRVAERLLREAGITIRDRRIVVLCDNPFRDFIVRHLVDAGAQVEVLDRLEFEGIDGSLDAILIAMQPRRLPIVGAREAALIAQQHPRALVVQFWGDLDRDALTRHGVRFWPLEAPPLGHQSIMLSSIGPEPVVRLQAGGLKVGELMARARLDGAGCEDAVAVAVGSGFAQALN